MRMFDNKISQFTVFTNTCTCTSYHVFLWCMGFVHWAKLSLCICKGIAQSGFCLCWSAVVRPNQLYHSNHHFISPTATTWWTWRQYVDTATTTGTVHTCTQCVDPAMYMYMYVYVIRTCSPGYVSIGLATCTYMYIPLHVHIGIAGIGPAFYLFTRTHGTVWNLLYTCKVCKEQCSGVR